MPPPEDSEFIRPRPVLDIFDEDENLKMRLNILKKDESELQAKMEQLAVERDSQLREMRRIRDEDQSQFLGNPVLGNRYLLQKLIGKGGFSEVFKAFDLTELRDVACKIHSLVCRIAFYSIFFTCIEFELGRREKGKLYQTFRQGISHTPNADTPAHSKIFRHF
jgi:hypothetical protein